MRGALWRTYIRTLIGRLKPVQAWQQKFSVMCNAKMMRCRGFCQVTGSKQLLLRRLWPLSRIY